jgi:putative ABC transport system permease protein
MKALARHARILFRSLARRPGYTLTAMLTLAVGIGASTAIFSIVQGTLLRPLPYPHPERLVRVWDEYVATGGHGPLSVPDYMEFRHGAKGIAALVGYSTGSVNLAAEEAPERARSVSATANFFDGLGVQPALGRGFREGEDRAGAQRIVVISNRLWRERFGGRADALGRTLQIDAEPYTVVGVLPASFWFPGDPQLVIPFGWNERTLTQNSDSRWLNAFARLKAGVTPEAAQSDLERVWTAILAEHPQKNQDWAVRAAGFDDVLFRGTRGTLWLLAGAVLLVLVIGCVNVANLMLVRGERRQRELAVRTAVGAGRARIIGGFLAESLTLAAVASMLGVALAWIATRLLLSLFGGALPRAEAVGLNPVVVLFAVGLALLTGLVVGLVPTLRLDARRVYDALREGGRSVSGGRTRLQRGLVAAEVALGVLLAAGAGLLLNSFWRLNHVDTGIQPDHAMAFKVSLPSAAYPDVDATRRFFTDAVASIRAIPGVRDVGISNLVPLLGGRNITTLASPGDPELQAKFVEIRQTTPGFFPAAGIPLLAGRALTEDDVRRGASVVVISDVLAKTIFPKGDALGQRISPGWGDSTGYEIVGIVGSVREFGIVQDKRPAVYWPYSAMGAERGMTFVVRTRRGDPLAIVPAIRRAIARLDPALPIYGVTSMNDVVLQTIGPRWFATALFTAFALIALLLSALGIFGVLAFIVEQRTHEVGIRIALGATRGGVTRLVVGQGMRLVLAGLVVGVLGAVLASRLMTRLLYQVQPADPLTLAAVAAVALLTALAASYLPARRAAMVEPMRVLREE